MSAYLVGLVEVTDPSWLAEYSKKVKVQLANVGAKYHVRSTKIESLEGDKPTPMSITIIGAVNKLTGVDVVYAVQQHWSDSHFRAGPIAFLFSHLSWISTAVTACYAGSFAYSSWAVIVPVAAVLGLGVIALWVVNTAVLIPQYLNHKVNDVVAISVA